jgi:hypothetical protein
MVSHVGNDAQEHNHLGSFFVGSRKSSTRAVAFASDFLQHIPTILHTPKLSLLL